MAAKSKVIYYSDEAMVARAELAAKTAGYPSFSECTRAFWAYMAQDPDAVCPRPVRRRYGALRTRRQG